MSDTIPVGLAGFKADYQAIFVEEWSPFVGAMLLVLTIIGLMLSGLVWGVFGGVKFWGDWFNNLIGLGPVLGIPQQTEGFLMHRMSLMNIMLVIGAFSAALLVAPVQPQPAATAGIRLGRLRRQPARHRRGTGRRLHHGRLLQPGAALLPGRLGDVGWAAGRRRDRSQAAAMDPRPYRMGHAGAAGARRAEGLRNNFPWLGLAVIVGVLLWATQWFGSADEKIAARAVIVVAGFAIGFIMHRSRLCFARAFREPFMTAEGDMTKAVILALAIGIPIAALLFQKKVLDPYLAIPPAFWIGSLVGGLIFGIGMVFAGGCASGSLWRMGEGHLKLWVTMFFFSWMGSVASAVFKKLGLTTIDETNVETWEMTKIGFQAYLPEMWGSWGWTLLAGGALLLLWYALVRYNESTEKFTLLIRRSS
jgi:uncharacterized membrane protein YedE/YeeE